MRSFEIICLSAFGIQFVRALLKRFFFTVVWYCLMGTLVTVATIARSLHQ